MRRTLIIALALPSLALGHSAGAAWVPVDCKDRMEEVRLLHKEFGATDIETAWRNHEAAVRRSRPGSPLYVPHPFPRTDAEIVANFKHAYFERLYEGTPWEKLPAKERPMYQALKEGRLRIEIVRVENWTLHRCTSVNPTPYFNLLRFFDERGRELGRSSQSFDGHMVLYHSLSKPLPPLPSLGRIAAFLQERFGRTLQPEQAQYVSLDGLPNCKDHRPDVPCVAFKAANKLYVIDGGQLLYEIAPAAPRKSVTAFRDERAAAGLAGLTRLGVIEYDAPLVTLGFEWAKARLVGGQKPQQ